MALPDRLTRYQSLLDLLVEAALREATCEGEEAAQGTPSEALVRPEARAGIAEAPP